MSKDNSNTDSMVIRDNSPGEFFETIDKLQEGDTVEVVTTSEPIQGPDDDPELGTRRLTVESKDDGEISLRGYGTDYTLVYDQENDHAELHFPAGSDNTVERIEDPDAGNDGPETCQATTADGDPCSNTPEEGSEYCHVHGDDDD